MSGSFYSAAYMSWWPETLYNLGSWLAWANDTTANNCTRGGWETAKRGVDPYGTGGTRPPNIWTGGNYHECPPPNISRV